jgi:hypothetical protein
MGTRENSPMSRKRTFIVKNYHFSREFHRRNKNGQHAENTEKTSMKMQKYNIADHQKILLMRMSLKTVQHLNIKLTMSGEIRLMGGLSGVGGWAVVKWRTWLIRGQI